MRSELIVGVVAVLGMMGCATSNGVGARDARGVAMIQPLGVFAHPRVLGVLGRLDAESLAPLSPEEQMSSLRNCFTTAGASCDRRW
jgi:hypothetical protein